jgi:hypothetical protein
MLWVAQCGLLAACLLHLLDCGTVWFAGSLSVAPSRLWHSVVCWQPSVAPSRLWHSVDCWQPSVAPSRLWHSVDC